MWDNLHTGVVWQGKALKKRERKRVFLAEKRGRKQRKQIALGVKGISLFLLMGE